MCNQLRSVNYMLSGNVTDVDETYVCDGCSNNTMIDGMEFSAVKLLGDIMMRLMKQVPGYLVKPETEDGVEYATAEEVVLWFAENSVCLECNHMLQAHGTMFIYVSVYMKYLGLVNKFIGMNFDVQPDFVKLHLRDYVESLLKDYGMEKFSSKKIPAVQCLFDVKNSDEEEPCDESEDQLFVGKLL
ncbi:hypothetical protein JCM33374_g4937 [Metschnikowia sp. JCM 33374]|nr:hypothetical protein JCM33374_g4937 [Metschnikowia sp. JCM 33374]